jgi:hypothetical protein
VHDGLLLALVASLGYEVQIGSGRVDFFSKVSRRETLESKSVLCGVLDRDVAIEKRSLRNLCVVLGFEGGALNFDYLELVDYFALFKICS